MAICLILTACTQLAATPLSPTGVTPRPAATATRPATAATTARPTTAPTAAPTARPTARPTAAPAVGVAPPYAPEQGRRVDPVVLTGADLPALVGLAPDQIVGWRMTGGRWQQIPVQVDERKLVDLLDVRGRNDATDQLVFLLYADPQSRVGPDSDPLFDADDELVFMARDLGDAADNAPLPPGVVPGSRVAVTVDDPLTGRRLGVVYLFRQDGSLDPGAGQSYVSYVPGFGERSRQKSTSAEQARGYGDESSSIETAAYRQHFSAAWIVDELMLKLGDRPTVNLLDRFRAQLAPGDCSRSEETFSTGNVIFLANKVGPVRAIRDYMGANSGAFTQRQHIFYAQRQDMTTYLRVHAINGLTTFIDWGPEATGMRYATNLNPDGVVIDGRPDVIPPGELQWQLIGGAAGSLFVASAVNSDIPNLRPTHFYEDNVMPRPRPCTGDGAYYGAGGVVLGGLPCTDPTRALVDRRNCGTVYRLSQHLTFYYLAPNLGGADAAQYHRQSAAPLTVQARALP